VAVAALQKFFLYKGLWPPPEFCQESANWQSGPVLGSRGNRCRERRGGRKAGS